MTFEEFGFDERIQKGIDEAGFKNPMPVQAQTFELLIKNHRDVYAQSQTGTGKTAAFLLSIFQLLATDEKYKGQKALIIVPTRELAVQIEAEGKMLGKYLDFTIGAVYGGVGYGAQEKMLENGAEIVVGTPGRLIDFSKQRKINLKDFGFLVIDEADRLFDMGFLPDLRRILKGMKPYNERHTLLFSATLNARVGNLAWEYMNDPGEVIIEPDKITVDTVSQDLYHVGKDEKMKLLLGILKKDEPENAVIFTNTRHSAWEVAKRLEVNGYAVEFLMGDLPQSKRLKIVEEVKKGNHKFLVATDVAARGLHIDELEMVINYDVPLEAESYVHRIGRTARAGREGKTVTMACEEYVYGLGPIERLLGRKIPVSWADEELIAEDKSEGMRFPPQQRYRELDSGNSRGGRDNHRDGGRGNRDDRRPSGNRDGRDNRGGRDNPGGRDNRDTRPSNTENRDSRPSNNENRNNRPAGNSNRDNNNKNGKRPPTGGKRPLDPRAAKIQSTVSDIVGGSLEDVNVQEPRKQNPRPENRKKPAKSRSGEKRKVEKPGNQPNAAKRGQDKRVRQDAPTERISSESSIDDRLEYYRKKYGEDFQLPGSSKKGGGSRSSGSKAKKSSKRPSQTGKPDSRKPKSQQGSRPSGNGKPASVVPEKKSDKTPEKKGLLGRLFGKD